MPSYDVCWNPSTPTPVTFRDHQTGGPYSGDGTCRTQTEYVYTATAACSDATVFPFTMHVQPDSTQIKLASPNDSGTIRFTDACSASAYIHINMSLKSSGGAGYTIDGGKPTIRNDPQRSFLDQYLVPALVVVVLAGIAFALLRRRRRKHP
jgi:hypothetical protein